VSQIPRPGSLERSDDSLALGARAGTLRGSLAATSHAREIEIDELRVDPRSMQAYVDGASAELTSTEFLLLYVLASEPGRVLSRDELLRRVWGRPERYRDRTVDVCVRRLRQKIDAVASTHSFIHTRFGVGYKLMSELKSLPRPVESGTRRE
jgi:DNA-binding response OmpR family regulator